MTPAPSSHVDALQLAEQALTDLELERLALSSIAMRAGRLARLLNEPDWATVFKYEIGGYPPGGTNGMDPEVWRLALLANRQYTQFNSQKNGDEFVYLESIEALDASEACNIPFPSRHILRDSGPVLTRQSSNDYVDQRSLLGCTR